MKALASKGGFWLDVNGQEYEQVVHYLKMCYHTQGEVANAEVWKIENLEVNFRFERKSASMLKVVSLVDVEVLSGENELEKVCARGFYMDKKDGNGLEFSTGKIESPRNNRKEHAFLYVDVAIGRSFVHDGRSVNSSIPVGYDSLYIPESTVERNHDGKFSLTEYQSVSSINDKNSLEYKHRYLVKDSSQMCPKYFIRFKSRKMKGIEEQSKYQASKNLTSSGLLRDITQLSKNESTRNQFDDRTIQTNNASTPFLSSPSNPNGKKSLTLEQIFSQAKDDIQNEDPIVVSKKNWIDRQLGVIDEKVRAINLNYADISEAITDITQRVTKQLQAETRRKLDIILSIQMELKREHEQINWIDNFILQELKMVLNATSPESGFSKNEQQSKVVEFLKLWKSHSIYRNNICRSRTNELVALSSLHSDLKLHDDLHIYVDPFYLESQSTYSPLEVEAVLLGSELPIPSKDVLNQKSNAHAAINNKYHQVGGSRHRYHTSEYSMRATFRQGSENSLSVANQDVLDIEIGKIQTAVAAALNSAKSEEHSYHLPNSITRPNITGERFIIPLHQILDELEEDVQEYNKNDQPVESLLISEEAKVIERLSSRIHSSNLEPWGSNLPLRQSQSLDNEKKEFASHLQDNFNQLSHESNLNSKKYPVDVLNRSERDISGDNDHRSLLPVNDGTQFFKNRLPHPVLASEELGEESSMPETGTKILANKVEKVLPGKTLQTIRVDSTTATRKQVDVNSEEADIDLNIWMEYKQMVKMLESERHSQFNLKDIAFRKLKQLKGKNLDGFQEPIAALAESKILEHIDAETLYFSLPFFTKLPSCKLIYSTDLHTRSLSELYVKSMKHKGPSLLIIRTSSPLPLNQPATYVIGAYLSHQISPTSSWSGSPSCFLFSCYLDIKIPYNARIATSLALSSDKEELRGPSTSPMAFLAQSDYLYIGDGDLSIDENLSTGSSEIENCYGIGLERKSKGALCLLAGSPIFKIEQLELWSIFNIK